MVTLTRFLNRGSTASFDATGFWVDGAGTSVANALEVDGAPIANARLRAMAGILCIMVKSRLVVCGQDASVTTLIYTGSPSVLE